MVVFPTQNGRFFEYEDFGMIDVCKGFIESGQIMIIAVDGIDPQTWTHPNLSVPSRVKRHEAYERHVIHEVLPFVKTHYTSPYKTYISTGCSMGGYHSANFFFRHPQIFDSLIALSGVYRLKLFLGDYMDEALYFHSPLNYLKDLRDPVILKQLRQNDIIISVGQGDWEEDMLEDTAALKQILKDKRIPAWIDLWGKDVAHDWPWWRKQMPYFLKHLKL